VTSATVGLGGATEGKWSAVSSRRIQPQAVWFFPSDYAGFWRRLAVVLIDAVTIAVLLIGVAGLVVAASPDDGVSDVLLPLCCLATVYGYFVILKRAGVHTVGYRLCGVRIVDPSGRPPGLGPLTLRLLFGLAGPLNILVDMVWIPCDMRRQSLRDKLAHTYVVKARARPAGPARVVHRHYHILGMSFVFQDVQPEGLGHG